MVFHLSLRGDAKASTACPELVEGRQSFALAYTFSILFFFISYKIISNESQQLPYNLDCRAEAEASARNDGRESKNIACSSHLSLRGDAKASTACPELVEGRQSFALAYTFPISFL
jgi:hypothetical protein